MSSAPGNSALTIPGTPSLKLNQRPVNEATILPAGDPLDEVRIEALLHPADVVVGGQLAREIGAAGPGGEQHPQHPLHLGPGRGQRATPAAPRPWPPDWGRRPPRRARAASLIGGRRTILRRASSGPPRWRHARLQRLHSPLQVGVIHAHAPAQSGSARRPATLPTALDHQPRRRPRNAGGTLVRAEGLEPPCHKALGPKPSASTNSATPAAPRPYHRSPAPNPAPARLNGVAGAVT